jgi:hypothetical protein
MGLSLRIASSGNRAAAAVRDYHAMLSIAEARLAHLQAAEKLLSLEEQGQEGPIAWRDRVEPMTDPLFARAGANRKIVWRLVSEAQSPDGRKVTLTSARIENQP